MLSKQLSDNTDTSPNLYDILLFICHIIMINSTDLYTVVTELVVEIHQVKLSSHAFEIRLLLNLSFFPLRIVFIISAYNFNIIS